MNRRVGLARVLSKRGYCSRSQAIELIRAGRVRVEGRSRCDPEFPIDADSATIEVDAKPVECTRKIYLMLNKPRGLVTTAHDEQDRETVYSLLPESLPWVGPVGRLDKASEGLLLFTNDSEWAARITSPESRTSKTYHVQIGAVAGDALLTLLTRGVRNGRDLLRADSARVVRSGMKNSWLEIVLREGRNRQIRRMCDALEIEVLRLIRIAIGPLQLGNLAKGAVRELTQEEIAQLSENASRA